MSANTAPTVGSKQSDGPGWLARECARLLDFGRRFPHPHGGSAWLDDEGRPDPTRQVFTWITARMAHSYSLGYLLGRAGDRQLAATALTGLTGRLRDTQHGGWVTSIAPDGSVPNEKSAYTHAFVVLAGSTGTVAAVPGAADLLNDALSCWNDRFFDPAAGLYVDHWDRTFTTLSPYRGVNANMHAVGALLAAADALDDPRWRQRALRIAETVVGFAEPHDWRIPEHFDPDWVPNLDHHRDQPDHPFEPYGATIGHGLEWSRLLLQLEASLGPDAPPWLLGAATSLFDRAVADGWAVDGADGFVYTTDWDGRPVVRDRMHWVAAEAAAAAAALFARTGDQDFKRLGQRWWAYIRRCLIDAEHGSWHHQLDPANQPIATVWPGKPDVYHAVQATILPDRPLAGSVAAAVLRSSG